MAKDEIPIPQHLPLTPAQWTWSIAWTRPDGIVHRLRGRSGETLFLKLSVGPRSIALQAEAQRLHWARDYLPVPEVVDSGTENGVDWLITRGMVGRDGTDAELLSDPVELVSTLARGLRRFHDIAPVDKCPFNFRLDVAFSAIEQRASDGLIIPEEDFQGEHQHLTLVEAIARLHERRPPTEELVVCHGDYCFPNALIAGGEVVAYLDLGELGVSDRWRDLAIATWSTTRNVGPGYEELFLEIYGVEPNPALISYYRLLSDLVS